jgi:hypothetical protein
VAPPQNDGEKQRDYTVRIFTDILKWRFGKLVYNLLLHIFLTHVKALAGLVQNTIRWGSLLDILYKHKLRFVDFHPRARWTKKGKGMEYNPKGTGNGKITTAMVKPFVEAVEGGGVKVNIEPWSKGEAIYRSPHA